MHFWVRVFATPTCVRKKLGYLENSLQARDTEHAI
jgi:hypothetical protein